MSFNPSSTIYLCNVPIDNTYQNQIYFSTRSEQQKYFASKVVKTFSDYLTVRATRPDGSLQSSVKVNANIDTLRSLPCNYMYYQNANHGTRFFYAFITKLVYINEGTTQIIFETDVYQTWKFDVEIKPSYVVREHSYSDDIGENLVPEKFNFQDYVYQTAHEDTSLNEWGYLVGATNNNETDTSVWEELFGSNDNPIVTGKEMSGIYQGLFFYYFHTVTKLNTFLNSVVEKNGECIVFIAVVPKFSVSGNTIGSGVDSGTGQGWVYGSKSPATKDIVITGATASRSFEGYAPVNNKLFTAPYYRLIVTNHQGQQAEYNIEDFVNTDEIAFRMYGDVSANPAITLIPLDYKGIHLNVDSGISISGFPQASFNTDTFKLWLAKNQYGIGLDTMGNMGQVLSGVGAMAAAPFTGGASLAVGGASAMNGVQGILSTVNGVYQASREPNKTQSGGGKTNLLTSMKENRFEYYIQTIRREHAITIDNFFTMYGYQTNKVKVPNVNARPYFNYVQTIDVNLIGGIPSDDMVKLKNMYNTGVTLWKSTATVGDYTVDNRPE